MDLTKGVQLRLKFVPGRRVFYTLDTQLEQQVQRGGQVVNEMEHQFLAHLRQRVLSADPDGCGHLVTITTPPVENPGDAKQVVYQRVSPTGAVLDVSGMNPTNSYALPEGAVKLDTTWKGEVILPLPNAPKPVNCITEYAVTGTTEFNGLQCVKIDCLVDDFEFDMPLQDGTGVARVIMGSHGSMLFAPEEGILARMEVETVTSPQIGNMIFTTSTMITQEFRSFEQ